ncbi:MAG: FkbM family methyltransferase [Synergistetes bacterium]|nr:FkbM family methyltransferase [Synergistota bacterium]
MNLISKISWRLKLLRNAMSVEYKVDWWSVFREILSSHSPEKIRFPSVSLVKEEDGFGFFRIGEREFYFPLSFYSQSLLGFIYWEVFDRKVYEGGNCLIQPGDWVVDAGACEGFFSLYALEKGANVLVFEPIPELAKALEMTLKKYIDEGRAKVFPLGLGSRNASVEMFVSRKNVGGSSFSKDRIDYLKEEPGCERKILRVAPLDELLRSNLLPPISFIKADVEGYERELLLGASEVIRRYKPRLSICTYHLPDDYIEIPKIVEGFGLNYKIILKVHGNTLSIMHAW